MNIERRPVSSDAQPLGRRRGSGFPPRFIGTLSAHYPPRDAANYGVK